MYLYSAQWEPWREWSECDSCGGERIRTRTCNPGNCTTSTGSTIRLSTTMAPTCTGERVEREPCEQAYDGNGINHLIIALKTDCRNIDHLSQQSHDLRS